MAAGNILVNTVKWKKCGQLYKENLKKADLNLRLDIQEDILKNGWTKIQITLRKNSEISDLGLAREIILRDYDKQDIKPKQNKKWNNQCQTILMSSRFLDTNRNMFARCMQQYKCTMQSKYSSTDLVEIKLSTQDKGTDTSSFAAREHLLQLIDRNCDRCSVHGGEISTDGSGCAFNAGNQTPQVSTASNSTELATVHQSKVTTHSSSAYEAPGLNNQRRTANQVLTDKASIDVSKSLIKQDPAGNVDCTPSEQSHIPPTKHKFNQSKPNGSYTQGTQIQKDTFGKRSGHDTKNINIPESTGNGNIVPTTSRSTNGKCIETNCSVPSSTHTVKTGKTPCSVQTQHKVSVGNLANSRSSPGENVSRILKTLQDKTK